ncbi:glutamate receptor ionotropic, delta-2 isoform X3 [Eurytemora carolleeae]|uniref:glutamate receptor ionotropic, delta-2 isoform X3 n=1 Tax=Eurytemora carolleeae TaxID=1294199 RepID=UPI000C75AF2A|nr:glutamate receptor ionotropic, delta-2 isoform X3 [Eurytemora carolleeae]|eukprot:XP_023336690.1 glutamate receptor ionotropic, delta-2-like isoform X3 [Eurytemora affinis]
MSSCLWADPGLRDEKGHVYQGLWSQYGKNILFKRKDQTSDPPFRVAYNNYVPRFQLVEEQVDMKTSEGYFLQTFLDRKKLKVEYMDMKMLFGNFDKKTGIWDGTVGTVGYGHADLGISYMAFVLERMHFVMYTHPVGVFELKWVSKYPDRVGSRYNLVSVFDINTWIATFLSIIGCSLALLFIVQVKKRQGFIPQQDTFLVLITPFSLITAEGTPGPDMFLTRTGRVFSGTIILFIWGLVSFLLINAFSCNLSAVLMKPAFQVPIDTAQQIVEEKKIVISSVPGYVAAVLSFSSNPWTKKLLESNEQQLIPAPGFFDVLNNLNADQVFYLDEEYALHLTKKEGRKTPLLYFGKETVRPYYTGWILENGSRWEEEVNQHVLQCNQAGFHLKLARESQPPKFQFEVSETRLSLEHLIVPLFILGGGAILSSSVFVFEIIWNKWKIKIKKNMLAH